MYCLNMVANVGMDMRFFQTMKCCNKKTLFPKTFSTKTKYRYNHPVLFGSKYTILIRPKPDCLNAELSTSFHYNSYHFVSTTLFPISNKFLLYLTQSTFNKSFVREGDTNLCLNLRLTQSKSDNSPTNMTAEKKVGSNFFRSFG